MQLSELIIQLHSFLEEVGDIPCGILTESEQDAFQFHDLKMKFLDLPEAVGDVSSVIALTPAGMIDEDESEEDLSEDGLGSARLVRGSHLDFKEKA